MAGLAIQGADSAEAKKIALAAYKVNLLKTISVEGEYSLAVEPWLPVRFIYSSGNTGSYGRVGVKFHSGSDFLTPDEIRVFGMLNGAVTGITSGSSQSTPSVPFLEVIPTQNLLTFLVSGKAFGFSDMAINKVKLHVFQ